MHAVSCLLLVDGDPVSGRKPLVILDVVDAILQVSKSLGQIYLQKVPQQILQFRCKVRREADLQRSNVDARDF